MHVEFKLCGDNATIDLITRQGGRFHSRFFCRLQFMSDSYAQLRMHYNGPCFLNVGYSKLVYQQKECVCDLNRPSTQNQKSSMLSIKLYKGYPKLLNQLTTLNDKLILSYKR